MQEQDWFFVVEENKFKEQSMKLVFPKGLPVLLIRKSGNEIYAVSDKCSHMACPLRGGTLDGYVLKCPCHDWRFDIRTGEFLDAPEIRIPVYKCKIEEGGLFINLEGSSQ